MLRGRQGSAFGSWEGDGAARKVGEGVGGGQQGRLDTFGRGWWRGRFDTFGRGGGAGGAVPGLGGRAQRVVEVAAHPDTTSMCPLLVKALAEDGIITFTAPSWFEDGGAADKTCCMADHTGTARGGPDLDSPWP